jgi:hypothetical protein
MPCRLDFFSQQTQMQDLPRLLYLYQLWGHKMFPKMQFREMIERVEKLCHRQNVMVLALAIPYPII